MGKRRLNLNEDYFSTIDTEAKAYFLGLMYADGYNNESTYQVNLVLQEEDKTILEKFKEELEYGGELKYTDKTGQNRKSIYRLTLYSKKLSQDLAKAGCIKAKSLVLTYPSGDILPTYLTSHFIRGYFDGDGCITSHKSSRQRPSKSMSFVGTRGFLLHVQEVLMEECGIKRTKLARHISTYALHCEGNKQVPRVFEYLYKSSSLYLTRKYNKFLING